jgi:hypothetical protein
MESRYLLSSFAALPLAAPTRRYVKVTYLCKESRNSRLRLISTNPKAEQTPCVQLTSLSW